MALLGLAWGSIAGFSPGDVHRQDPVQVLLVERDEVFQALAAQGANHSLGHLVRPWGSDRRQRSCEAAPFRSRHDVAAVGLIPIAQQELGPLSPRGDPNELAPEPSSGGMLSHGDVQQFPADLAR
jgi:hypothetical protein